MDDRLGYTKLWRRIWNNEWLVQPGHEFTRLEAWLDIVNNLAAGIDTPELKRGELVASDRFLASRWSWSKTRVRRFKEALVSRGMLKNSPDHLPDHLADRFIVCNYETYNGERTTNRTTNRTKEKKEKEGEISSPNGERVSAAETLVAIYREENQKLPEVRALSEERKRKCRIRVNRACKDGRLNEYLTDFRNAVAKAQNSAFLTGHGERGWKASFEWFIQNDSNLLNVLEGKYDDGPGPKRNSNGAARPLEPEQSNRNDEPEHLDPDLVEDLLPFMDELDRRDPRGRPLVELQEQNDRIRSWLIDRGMNPEDQLVELLRIEHTRAKERRRTIT